MLTSVHFSFWEDLSLVTVCLGPTQELDNGVIWGSNLTFKIPDNTSQTPCGLNTDKNYKTNAYYDPIIDYQTDQGVALESYKEIELP